MYWLLRLSLANDWVEQSLRYNCKLTHLQRLQLPQRLPNSVTTSWLWYSAKRTGQSTWSWRALRAIISQIIIKEVLSMKERWSLWSSLMVFILIKYQWFTPRFISVWCCKSSQQIHQVNRDCPTKSELNSLSPLDLTSHRSSPPGKLRENRD